MPPGDRSLARVSAMLGHAVPGTVNKWSSSHRWVERVRAYDNYVANTAITVRTVDLAEAQRAQMQQWSMFSVAANAVVQTELRRLAEKQRKEESIDPLDVKRLVDAAEKLDTVSRRNLGMPTAYRSDFSDAGASEDDGDIYFIGKKVENEDGDEA